MPSSSLLVEEAVLARHLRRAGTPATCGGEQEQNDVVDRRIVQRDRQRFERKEERSVEQAEVDEADGDRQQQDIDCLLYTSPSPRDLSTSRMPSSA